jgi:uncharacterized cupredoxin-like copper-binding protein
MATACLILSVTLVLLSSALGAGRATGPGAPEWARPDVIPLTAPTNVAISLTDTPSFDPNNLTVANGTAVSFSLKNVGTLNHTFALLKTPNLIIPRNVTPQQLDAMVANATWVNYPLTPGASAGFNVTFTAPFTNGSSLATFEYLSTVPYQYQSGMFGYVNVTSAPKGPPQVLFLNGTGSYQWVPQDLGVSVTSLPVSIAVLAGDIGGLDHTWTLDPTPNDTAINPSTWPSVLAAHPPPPGANVTLSGGGASTWANFTLTKPGIYTFICTIPGHYANGMNGSLYVNVPIPTVVTPSSALVNPALLAGAGGLFVAGVILVAVAAFKKRL